MRIADLMKEALDIKTRIDADRERLAQINTVLAAGVQFKNGSKTARIAEDGYLAKVQLRETVSWDQEALCRAVKKMGVSEFRKGFTFEYKPRSARILKDWLASPETSEENRKLIAEARQVKNGLPSVSIEYVGGEEE